MAYKANPFHAQPAATVLVVALLAAGVATPVLGQAPARRNFEQNVPAVGEMMPDVVVYDRAGGTFGLRDLLRERLTVLILGWRT